MVVRLPQLHARAFCEGAFRAEVCEPTWSVKKLRVWGEKEVPGLTDRVETLTLVTASACGLVGTGNAIAAMKMEPFS